MIISGKRKRKLDKKLFRLKEGSYVVPSVPISNLLTKTLLEIGFTNKMEADNHYLIIGQLQKTEAAIIVAEIDYIENEKHK